MSKYAFKAKDYGAKPDQHVVTVTHEDNLFEPVVHAHKSMEKAHDAAHAELTDHYRDETPGREIGKREAHELIRSDSKMGVLKWSFKHPASCGPECKQYWGE